jgi:hypothetical protein
MNPVAVGVALISVVPTCRHRASKLSMSRSDRRSLFRVIVSTLARGVYLSNPTFLRSFSASRCLYGIRPIIRPKRIAAGRPGRGMWNVSTRFQITEATGVKMK